MPSARLRRSSIEKSAGQKGHGKKDRPGAAKQPTATSSKANSLNARRPKSRKRKGGTGVVQKDAAGSFTDARKRPRGRDNSVAKALSHSAGSDKPALAPSLEGSQGGIAAPSHAGLVSMPPPQMPGSIPTILDESADLDGAGALLQLSPARDSKASRARRSPARSRKASFSTSTMNKLLLSTPKRNMDDQGDILLPQPDQDCLLDVQEGHSQWEQASTAAAMILSGLSPLSTPVKSNLGAMRSPQQYPHSNNPLPYSPFSTFAKQLSPLVTMGGSTPAMPGQKAGLPGVQPEPSWAAAAGAYHMYQESYGVTPSPMRAAIENGALSMAAGLLSPAPSSSHGIPGPGRQGRLAGRIGRPLNFQIDDEMSGTGQGKTQKKGGSRGKAKSASKKSSSKKNSKAKSKKKTSAGSKSLASSVNPSAHIQSPSRMKFELRPNCGVLSQGLHPMGAFFAGTPGGSGPPPGAFNPLSQSTSPRTWARSPPRGGNSNTTTSVFYHRSNKSNAKRGLISAPSSTTKSKKGKTPGTTTARKRREGSRGADGSSSSSRISQAAKLRAALAMREFELMSLNGKGIPGIPPPTQPCNCKKSQCLKLYCECFAAGIYCSSCNCLTCANNAESGNVRRSAVRATLERNPHAFKPKVKEDNGKHSKGCHCKRSMCLKKYCECYQAGITCGALCKCNVCENYEGSVKLKRAREAKPKNRSSSSKGSSKESKKAKKAAMFAESNAAASFAKVRGHKRNVPILMPKIARNPIIASPAVLMASPAVITPGSPASEATSELSAHSASAQAAAKGIKLFGKRCPHLKKPTIFHVSSVDSFGIS